MSSIVLIGMDASGIENKVFELLNIGDYNYNKTKTVFNE